MWFDSGVGVPVCGAVTEAGAGTGVGVGAGVGVWAVVVVEVDLVCTRDVVDVVPVVGDAGVVEDVFGCTFVEVPVGGGGPVDVVPVVGCVIGFGFVIDDDDEYVDVLLFLGRW